MERKIGEIFNCDGEWYQCVEEIGCNGCAFDTICDEINDIIGNCTSSLRHDDKSVVFKRLEKVGEPFERNGYMYQEYKAHIYPLLMSGGAKAPTPNGFAVIMEENNNAKHSNSENIGKNLKPFNLEAAKSGKPVCTRDGRKERILCYDFKQNDEYPLLVAVENIYGKECPLLYSNDGICDNYKESNCELAMLPEKREGWVNVYKENDGVYYMDKIIHKTEKFAFDVACPDNYIGTVKIEWHE